MLPRVVRCLKEADVARLTVSRVHAIGAGVDPDVAKLSLDECSECGDKALVQCICEADRSEALAELVARTARTGRRGDGIVSLHPVVAVWKIRTGDRGPGVLS